MAYEPLKTEELKKLLLMGKRRPMNFAYNPGPKDADLLIIDKIKAADVIARIAKKEGEGAKVAFGTYELDAKAITLSVSQTVPGLAKKFRKYLKSLDLSLKVIVLDAEGDLLESDEEETPSYVSSQSRPAGPSNVEIDTSETPGKAELTERLRALQGPVASLGALAAPLKKAVLRVVANLKASELDQAHTTLAKIEEGVRRIAAHKAAKEAQKGTQTTEKGSEHKDLVARAGAIKTALGLLQEGDTSPVVQPLVQAVGLIKNGDLDGAEAQMRIAEAALEALQVPAVPSEPSAGIERQEPPEIDHASFEPEWRDAAASLEEEANAALLSGFGDAVAIQRALDTAMAQANAGKYASALDTAQTLRRLLDEATPPVSEASDNLVAYHTSRLNWIATRNTMLAELTKLKMVIDTMTLGSEGLSEIAENTASLLAYFDTLDTTLESVLSRLINAPEGPAREALKLEAGRIIDDYRKTLDTDFFKAVDENGFTETAIRSTALDALEGVEMALAA